MRTVAVFLAMLIIAGCEDFGIEVPPNIPVGQLLQTPDTITVDGARLYLTTNLWRDFMPSSSPSRHPLMAILYVTTTDSSQVPSTVSADAVWTVYDNQTWASYLTSEPISTSLQRPYRYVRIARDGPSWGPHVYIDVIVRVTGSDGTSQLLRAPGQWIGRTD